MTSLKIVVRLGPDYFSVSEIEINSERVLHRIDHDATLGHARTLGHAIDIAREYAARNNIDEVFIEVSV